MSLIDLYEAQINTGQFRADAAQRQVAERLSLLAGQLQGAGGQKGFFSKWLASGKAPKSLYIYGEVGRGKTHLMDLFYQAMAGLPKRRIHFHAFMQEVHQRRAATKAADVIAQIAADIATTARLLCLDEMQVTDVADAMILGRLLAALLDRGVVIVTTSNLPPEGLYKDGLNRDLFLPAIAMMRQAFDIVPLSGGQDYRLGRLKGAETFLTPLDAASAQAFQKIWRDLTETEHGLPIDITVLGRKLHVPEAAHGCARFRFAALCEAPLGPADYLAIATAFQTLFVAGIPGLAKAQRNEAKRLVLLIDTLYDRGRRLVATSAKPPAKIYPAGDHSFEFERTASRLVEMQSNGWWEQPVP